jgi:hypothetical protein
MAPTASQRGSEKELFGIRWCSLRDRGLPGLGQMLRHQNLRNFRLFRLDRGFSPGISRLQLGHFTGLRGGVSTGPKTPSPRHRYATKIDTFSISIAIANRCRKCPIAYRDRRWRIGDLFTPPTTILREAVQEKYWRARQVVVSSPAGSPSHPKKNNQPGTRGASGVVVSFFASHGRENLVWHRWVYA